MIIQGVFSMSIIDNLKSLFKRDEKKEEKGIHDLSYKSKNDAKVTSSNNFDKSIVSGTKTVEPMVNLSSRDNKKVTFKKDVKTSETSDVKEKEEIISEVDETEEKTEILDEIEVLTNVDSKKVEKVSEDENITTETEFKSIDESTDAFDNTKVEKESISEDINISEIENNHIFDGVMVSGIRSQESIFDDKDDEVTFKKDVKTSETNDGENTFNMELDEVEEKSVDSSKEVVNDEKVENEVSKNNNKKRDNMTLLTDKELLTDANRDKEFTAEFIDAGIETVKHCFQCGTCGGGCPSGRRTPYKVRQIVRKCLLGLKEEVISDDALWMCTTCYTCQERCPRSVKIVEIIKKARNIAAHAGYMALAHKKTGLFVIKTGHGVPINDATKALRVKIGLSELPATTHSFPEALEEVQKICKITAFDDLIGYDEATGDLKE